MGTLIHLDERRRSRPDLVREPAPAFYFDIGSPVSYLAGELLHGTLEGVRWIPVTSGSLTRLREKPTGTTSRASDAPVNVRLQRRIEALRRGLVTPERARIAAPRAQRACAYAVALGAGPEFATAAARLAFCGGFDLEDRETLAEAAASAGLPLGGCLAAARDHRWDDRLRADARSLLALGATQAPVIEAGGRWWAGEDALMAPAGLLRELRAHRRITSRVARLNCQARR